jgi:hypothetical protein
MAETSGFFPDVSGDREYTSDWLAKYIAAFISNGVYKSELAVTADGSAMAVTLPAGRAWINGYHYRNDGDMTLAIDNADGILNRIDIVVLRWDINNRSITAQVIKGTPASSAAAPVITRTVEQYDLKLAEISIPTGTTAITQSLITDTRLDSDVCGIVHATVDHIDTTTFYNQIQDDLAQFRATNEADFTAWVEGLKDVLDADTAGNLLNLINTHKSDASAHVTALTCTKSGTVYVLTGLTATSGFVPVMFSGAATYANGDTVTIDGTAYTLKTTNGSALTTGAWIKNSYVAAIADVDNKILYVSPSVLKNPIALTVSAGYGSSGSTVYDGSAARTAKVPYVTFHTSSPSTVANGEIYCVYE